MALIRTDESWFGSVPPSGTIGQAQVLLSTDSGSSISSSGAQANQLRTLARSLSSGSTRRTKYRRIFW